MFIIKLPASCYKTQTGQQILEKESTIMSAFKVYIYLKEMQMLQEHRKPLQLALCKLCFVYQLFSYLNFVTVVVEAFIYARRNFLFNLVG